MLLSAAVCVCCMCGAGIELEERIPLIGGGVDGEVGTERVGKGRGKAGRRTWAAEGKEWVEGEVYGRLLEEMQSAMVDLSALKGDEGQMRVGSGLFFLRKAKARGRGERTRGRR